MVKILRKFQNTCDRLLRLRDCPYKLAKSISLGFGLAFLPLPGINIPLGMILGKILKLNIVAVTIPALLLTYVSPFLYLINYKTGAMLIGHDHGPPEHYGFEVDLSFIDKVVDFFAVAGPAYLLGSAINAVLVATLSYFIFLFIYNNTNKLSKKVDKKKIKLGKSEQTKLDTIITKIKKPKVFRWKNNKKDPENNNKFPS